MHNKKYNSNQHELDGQTLISNFSPIVQLIDLYVEHFDPTYSAEELSLYHQGGQLIPWCANRTLTCRTVIFITPGLSG